jgi:hypothetical protein
VAREPGPAASGGTAWRLVDGPGAGRVEVGIRLLEAVRDYLRREPVGRAYGSRSDLS